MPLLTRDPQTLCDGTSRRGFLRVGGLGFAGLTLAELYRREASAAVPVRRPKSVIWIVLSGGLSHLDSFDPKPDAPAEFRGAFGTVPTNLPGVRVCDLLPRHAAMMDQFALIRGLRSVENDHFLSEVYSGLPRTAGKRPAFGSVASRSFGTDSALPPYVSLRRPSDEASEFEKPHYAGSHHAPFRPYGDALENLGAVKSPERLADRRGLLAGFDTMRRDLDRSDGLVGIDRFQARAFDMISSPKVREAFDVSKEPAGVLERYGKGGKFTHQTVVNLKYDWPADAFVTARRLVEAGVRVVTLSPGSWDHHSGAEAHIFDSYKLCLPALDASVTALVNDLAERGLADDVLVAVVSEFGRTPKVVNPGPGREHWADAGCILLAGGGVKVGQVVGETDRRGERAKSGSLTFQNLMATVYGVLGIDPKATLPDFGGRPTYLLDDPVPIAGLLG